LLKHSNSNRDQSPCKGDKRTLRVPRLGLPSGARPSDSACNGAMARKEDLTPRML